jgi:hypothetical protein
MARLKLRQSSFAGGEIADHVHGRADLSKYLTGARELFNMIPLVHGSVVNRPGTEFIAQTHATYAEANLYPGDGQWPTVPDKVHAAPFLVGFEYAEDDTYLLEIGRHYIRPFRDGAPILTGTEFSIDDISDPAAHTTRCLVEVTAAQHTFAHGDLVYIDDVGGSVELNKRYWYVRIREGHEIAIDTVTENVTMASSPTAISSVTDTSGIARVVTSVGHGYTGSEDVICTGVDGEMGDEINGKMYEVGFIDATTFDLLASSVAGLTAGTTGSVDEVTSYEIEVDPDGNHYFENGDHVYIDGVSGAMGTYVNDQWWIITWVSAVTFTLNNITIESRPQGTGGWCDCKARTIAVTGSPIADDEFYLMDLQMNDVDYDDLTAYTSGGTVQRRYDLRKERAEDKSDVPYLDADAMELHRAQSADVMVLVHRSWGPRELIRADHDDWSCDLITFQPEIATPENLTVTAGTGSEVNWYVTAISEDTAEESSPATVQSLDPNPAVGSGTAITIQWDAVTGAQYYYVYRDDQTYRRAGFLGIVDDDGEGGPFTFATAADAEAIEPDFTIGPPSEKNPFSDGDGSGDCPGAVVWHEQRLFFASTTVAPQQIWASVVGTYYNLNDSVPIDPSDSLNFIVASTKENRINNLISLSALIAQTTAREFKVVGAGGSLLTAQAGGVEVLPQSHIGSGPLQALTIEDGALFVADTGPDIRDLAYQYEVDGFKGSDLSVLVPHFLEGYSLVDWDYAKAPYRTLWLVRSDGILLCLSYHKEHNVWGWSKHQLQGGDITSVAAVREGRSHSVYLAVGRTIDGNEVHYIEKFHSRDFRDYDMNYDVKQAFFVDCGLTYDEPIPATPGIDDDANYVHPATGLIRMGSNWNDFTIDSGTWPSAPNWDGDYIDASGFEGTGGIEEGMNGKRFYVIAKSGSPLFSIQVVLVESEEDVEYTTVDSTYMSGWVQTRFGVFRKAVKTSTRAHHLEGEEVQILADGKVAAPQTVTDGAITLGDDVTRAGIIHLGLGITSRIELLDAETNDPANPIRGLSQNLEGCAIQVRNSRGIEWGPDTNHLTHHVERPMVQYGTAIELENGVIRTENLRLTGEYNHSRLVIQQTNPLPIEILAVIREIDVKMPPKS